MVRNDHNLKRKTGKEKPSTWEGLIEYFTY